MFQGQDEEEEEEEETKLKPRKWIKAVSSDLPPSALVNKKRHCGLCKSRMEFKEENDAWICLNTRCAAYLPRGYGIGPTKGDQEELVTITDPYGDLQRPFVKMINHREKKMDYHHHHHHHHHHYHNLKRPVTERHKVVRHPNEILKE